MRKICSGIISCFVAAAMVVTSAGMPVMADTLLVDETKGCEVLKETDELIPDEPDADAIDNGVLTYADEPLADIEETTDKENNDTESETVSSADDENDPDAKIGLPIDLPDGSDRGNTWNDRKPEGEGHIGEELQNGDMTSASPVSEGAQSGYSHGIKATENAVEISASGIYRNWDGISNVTQFKDPNGGMYYAINSESEVRICRVEAGSPVSKVITLEKKHPLYGTAACDGDGNFYLVTGESNNTDDTSVETVFISKYDSNGNFIATTGDNGSSSLASYYDSGFYTKIPFEGGNCDAAVSGDFLTVNYARKMYSGHQSNSAFTVNVKDMSRVSVGTFYESHSFAQRVVPVGTGFVYVSEGDCYNRTFTIYNARKTDSGFTGSEKGIFDFWVKDGALESGNMYVVNENFAHMGGLTALTDGRVAFAAQSARSLNESASGEKEDIFIQIFDPSKNLKTAEAYTTEGIRSGLAGPNGRDEVTDYGVKWLTSLSDTESISNVQIASTSDDTIVVFFEYSKDNSYKGVYYIVLDKDGNVIRPSAVFDADARLNPCETPVYTDGMICWVGNKNNESGGKIYAYSLFMNDVSVPVTGVELNKTELTLGMNETEVLTATVLPDNATNRNVTWNSNKKDTVTVDDKGEVKAVSVGEAIVTVTTEDGGFTASCTVTALGKKDAAVTIAENSPITKTYGDSGFTLTAAAGNKGTGTGAWTWESSNTAVATVSNAGAVTVKGAGESVIKVYYESDTTAGEASVTLKVDPKALDISWNNTSFDYDGSVHKPTATLTGVISGDACTVSVSGEQTNAGTYTATAALSGAASGNYALQEDKKTCSFTINKAGISGAAVTLGSALTYTGSEQTQTVSKVTLRGNEIPSSGYTVTNNKGTNAGSYTLTVTAKENSNYTGSVTKGFTIGKKAVTPAITVTGSYSFTGSDITPAFTVKDGNTLLASSDYTASITDNKNAGTGKITVSQTTGGNYSFSPVMQNFTINKAAAKTPEDVAVEQTYTGTSVSVSVAGKMPADAGTLTFTAGTATITKVSGSTTSVSGFVVDGKGNVSATVTGGTAGDVITLPVTISSANYADSAVKVVVTLLAKSDAAVTIAGNSPITKTYGDSGFTLTAAAGNKGTGTGAWTWESSNTAVATVSNAGAVTVKGAGESVIKVHYESDTTVGEAAITLKVNAKTLGITWSNTSFIYDGASHKPAAALTGVINGDDCTVTVSGEQTGEGTYTATASLNGAASSNYILPADQKTCTFKISKIKVSNIEITGASDPVSMQKGDKIQLGATVTPANAADKTVKWSSSRSDVVTVDNTGLITAVSYGEAVITAEANDGSGVKATLTVKVASVKVTGIELRAPGGTVLVPGSSMQIEAVITPSNATDKTLTWTSSDTTVATVDDNGMVTVLNDPEPADGTTFTVTASSKDGVSTGISFTIKKNDNPVTSVKIDPKSVKTDAKPGDTFRLSAIIEPDNATDKTVTWESSDTGTAEISPAGLVTVKDYGKTTITVKAANEKNDTFILDIRKIAVTGIAIDTAGGDDHLAIGKSTQLSAVITPSNASVKDIVWTSSDTKLADVDANGVVTGKAQGKVTITATSVDDSSKKSSIDLIIFDDNDTLYVEFAYGSEYIYTGKPIMPLINVYNRGKLLMQETDYTVKFTNNVNANDGTNAKKAPRAVVTGKTLAATAEAVFSILPKDIGDEKSVSAEEVNIVSGKTATPLLYYGGTKLGAKDFTNPYAKDKFTESRAITVSGTGNFTGEREVWINVRDDAEIKSIPKIKVLSFNPAPKAYNGQPQYISKDEIVVVSASDRSKTPLVMDKDFFIAYPDDVTNAGTVKITVIGMGDYAGSAGKSYNIEPAKNGEAIKNVEATFPDAEGKTGGYDSFEYRSGGVLPAVEILVTHSNGKTETLAAGRDYKVTYKDNTKAGAANKNKPATATITFLGNYKSLGKMTKNFYIDQADLGRAKVFAPDKVINKEQPKYPISEPVADIDGTTVNKKEYTVTYRVNDGEKDIVITSKDKLYKALAPGESIAVTVEIKAKTDKNGALTGNYKGTSPVCRYNITRTDADHDLSKATVILQKKGDAGHKAVKQLGFTGNPIVIGSGEYSDYELYVYMGKKNSLTVLKEGTDFRVDHSNNVNAGKATVMINGCAGGQYYGSKTFTFKIVKGRMRWAR